MAFSISSPVTGAAITDHLTSPTYTLTADNAPGSNVRAYYVSGLGGTQTGVLTHYLSAPFQIAFAIPKILRAVTAFILAVSGVGSVPKNTYALTVRKGVSVNTDGGVGIAYGKLILDIPVNSETVDAPNLAAMVSLLCGAGYAEADSMLTSAKTGTL